MNLSANIEGLSKQLEATNKDVVIMKKDISGIKLDISNIKSDVKTLQEDVKGIDAKIVEMENNLNYQFEITVRGTVNSIPIYQDLMCDSFNIRSFQDFIDYVLNISDDKFKEKNFNFFGRLAELKEEFKIKTDDDKSFFQIFKIINLCKSEEFEVNIGGLLLCRGETIHLHIGEVKFSLTEKTYEKA